MPLSLWVVTAHHSMAHSIADLPLKTYSYALAEILDIVRYELYIILSFWFFVGNFIMAFALDSPIVAVFGASYKVDSQVFVPRAEVGA